MSEPPKPAPEATKITAVRFLESIPFNGETLSVTAADVSIIPARLEHDGRVVPIEKGQVPGGLMLTRRFTDRVRNVPAMERVYVPMALVRGIIYGA